MLGHAALTSGLRRHLAALADAVKRLTGTLTALDARHASRLDLGPLAWWVLRGVNQRRIRARCMALRLPGDVAICRVLGRYKMYVQASDHAHAVHLMFDGYWEMAVTQVVASLVQPGMVAVDVGANQGYYTLLLAGLVGPRGQVHAVEPNAGMTALLRRSVAANGFAERVQVHERPLGDDASRRVVLRVPEGTPSGAWLEPAGDDPVPGAMVTATLDGLLGDARVDFVKIDAEGAETAIWRGMAGILARRAPLIVVMEFVADRATDAAAFLDAARQQGFDAYHIHTARGLQPIAAAEILAAPSHREWMLVLRRGATSAGPAPDPARRPSAAHR